MVCNKCIKRIHHKQCENNFTFEEIIYLFAQKTNFSPRPYRNGYITRCSSHEDRHPSLSIKQADDGRTLLHCFRGCSKQELCTSIGITLKDLFTQA